MTSGIMIGASSRVLSVFLPGNSYRTKAKAARIPMVVENTAVRDPRIKEFLKAINIGSFWASLTNHLRLTPFIGKQPNCSGLNESTITTAMGANMKTYTSIV